MAPTAGSSWVRGAVGYEVYVRSFADSTGDGVGDLAGIRDRLDHLRWLGVDALWVTPFYPSPGADHGYDVSDYIDVDARHGTLEDFDGLLDDAHRFGLKVLIDLVPNHCSSHHRWFRRALEGRESPYRDYFLWRDPAPDGGPPNNWVSLFGGPAWTLDPASGQYYCHLFLPEQPDLNWGNPAVQAEFDEILRFWCDRGADGFRVDVAFGLVKDPQFRDNPRLRAITEDMAPDEVFDSFDHVHDIEQPPTLQVFDRFKRVVAEYGAVLVGEVRANAPEAMARYVEGEGLDLAFYLEPGWSDWNAEELLQRHLAMFLAVPEGVGWITDNHDQPRSVTRFGGGERGVRRSLALTGLQMALGGMPFLYQGQELGLGDGRVGPGDVADPISTRNAGAAGRDGARTVMPWDDGPHNGFSKGPRVWLPAAPREASESVESQSSDPESVLNRYRGLIRARSSLSDLVQAEPEILSTYDDAVVLRRGTAIVAANLGAEPVTFDLPAGRWKAVFSSTPGTTAPAGNALSVPAETTVYLTTGA